MKKQTKKRQITTRQKAVKAFRHIFVPHKHNKYQPHIVRLHGIVAVLVVIVVLQLSYNFVQTGRVLGVKTAISQTELLEETNSERVENGGAPLAINAKLAKAAELKANDMFQQQYWAHVAPDGATPWQWFGQAKYSYASAGENLAKGFHNSSGVVTAWMNSSEHRENLLNQDYKDVGFAIKNGVLNGEKTTLIVALYGSVKASAGSRQVVLASSDSSLGVVSRIGVGIQSITPAALGSIALLLATIAAALAAHAYRKKLPYAVQKTWKQHHGLYKAVGMSSLAVVMLVLYGGGQI